MGPVGGAGADHAREDGRASGREQAAHHAFVAGRYLTALVGMLAGLAFSWALAQAVTRLAASGGGGAAALLSLEAHAFLFGLLAFAAAVFLPLYFRFGAGRALLYFSAIAVAALIVVSLPAQFILAEEPALLPRLARWVKPRLGQLLGAFVGAAALAMGVSLLLSRRIYEVRDL